MEIFVRDAYSETGKWHPVLVHVIFTFAPLGVGLKMYEDTKWHNEIPDFKQFFDSYTLITF